VTTKKSDLAGRCPRAWAVLLVAAAVFLAADLISKRLAFARLADDPVAVDRAAVLETMRAGASLQTLLPPHDPTVVVPSVLEFKLVLNAGAVFGAGAGKRWVFVAFTIVSLGFALWVFARWTDRRWRLTHTGIALIIAGGLGNLYDRLAFGCVRDFLHPLPGVRIPFGLTWPGGSDELWPYVSNVADALLLVGIAIVLVRLWTTGDPDAAGAPGATADQER